MHRVSTLPSAMRVYQGPFSLFIVPKDNADFRRLDRQNCSLKRSSQAQSLGVPEPQPPWDVVEISDGTLGNCHRFLRVERDSRLKSFGRHQVLSLSPSRSGPAARAISLPMWWTIIVCVWGRLITPCDLSFAKVRTHCFSREAEIVGDVVPPHMEFQFEARILASPGQKTENERRQLLQRRAAIERCHLFAGFGKIHGKTMHEFGTKPRLLLHSTTHTTQRKGLKGNAGQCFCTAELRFFVIANTDEVAGKPKGNDLAPAVPQQSVEPHHPCIDAVDVGLVVAFIECVLMRFQLPQMGIDEQVLGRSFLSGTHVFARP